MGAGARDGYFLFLSPLRLSLLLPLLRPHLCNHPFHAFCSSPSAITLLEKKTNSVRRWLGANLRIRSLGCVSQVRCKERADWGWLAFSRLFWWGRRDKERGKGRVEEGRDAGGVPLKRKGGGERYIHER